MTSTEDPLELVRKGQIVLGSLSVRVEVNKVEVNRVEVKMMVNATGILTGEQFTQESV